MFTVQNISNEVQAFTGIPAFTPGEIRKISKADLEVIANSPHMELITGDTKTVKEEPEIKAPEIVEDEIEEKDDGKKKKSRY